MTKPIRFYSVQRSGSNYLLYLLEQNYDVKGVGHPGEKHAEFEKSENKRNGEPCLHLVRNPVAWAVSFHNFAHHFTWHNAFTPFTQQLPRYAEIWSRMNKNFADGCDMSVRYEDVVATPELACARIANEFGFERKEGTWVDTDKHMMKRPQPSRKDFDKGAQRRLEHLKHFTPQGMRDFIALLDKDLCKRLNYEFSAELSALPREEKPMSKILQDMSDIQSRTEIPEFLKRHGLNKRICEVGVRYGYNLEQLLRADPELAVAIDHYETGTSPGQQDTGLSIKELKQLYADVFMRFIDNPAVKIYRGLSKYACEAFPQFFFDYVYLDADHSFKGALEDINRWWPRVRQGGIMAGHDYSAHKAQNGVAFGVIEAVQDFMRRKETEAECFHVTAHGYKTWMIYKREGE